jgi:hypothetical protein
MGALAKLRSDVRIHQNLWNSLPGPDVIGPVRISCPRCDTELGYGIRVTLESAWSASKRSPAAAAYLVCPSCHKAWVASLALSIAAFAVEGQAA